MTLLIVQLNSPVTSSLLVPNNFLRALFSKTLSLLFPNIFDNFLNKITDCE
jgi:hypothetical protein